MVLCLLGIVLRYSVNHRSDPSFKFADKIEYKPIIFLIDNKEKTVLIRSKRTEALAQVLISIILNNSNLSTVSFALLRFKAFTSWVSNSMLNLHSNKLGGNLRTCIARHT